MSLLRGGFNLWLPLMRELARQRLRERKQSRTYGSL